jgi:hypothetical protein
MFTRLIIGVSVKDKRSSRSIPRSWAWKKTFDRVFDTPMARLIGVPGVNVRIVHLKLGTGVLELFDYAYPLAASRALTASKAISG